MVDPDVRDAIANAPTVESTPDDSGEGPRRAPRVAGDKYRIVESLGAGALGTVYRARDTTLDRDVALEVGPEATEETRRRIEAEVQTLAKLVHPNVVAVYEVGEVDGHVAIAREHVPGGDARSWAAERARTALETIALYCAAGDGLVAAHAAGIVHGAVRAAAILVGDDGRPRLAGFAPARADADPRDDQRAFCTTLADALAELRGVPGHVVEALGRGRAGDWPGMADLLAELRWDPRRQRRRLILVLGAVGAVAGAAAVTLILSGRGQAPCSDDEAAITPVWSGERAAAIGRAFEAAGGGGAWPALRGRLDSYAGAWTAAHHAACVATRIDHAQPEPILDKRMLCLDRGKAQLASLVAALGVGGRAVIEQAPVAASVLPDLERCSDVTALARTAAVPVDPAVRAAIETASRAIADARTQLDWGVKHGVETGDSIVAAATATGWAPLIAEAKLVRAALLMDSQEVDCGRSALEEAMQYALANNEDELAAVAMAFLGRKLAETGHAEEAEHWLALGHGLWTKLGEPPGLGNLLLQGDSDVANGRGKFDIALSATRRAIELAQKERGGPAPADSFALANALGQAGNFGEATKEAERALAMGETAFGKNHPQVEVYASKAAEVELYMAQYPEALAHAARSVAIGEAWYGKDDVHLIDGLEMLGATYGHINKPDEARATLARATAILKAHNPDAGALNDINTILGDMESRLGNWEAAAERAQQMIEFYEGRFGKDSPYVMTGLLTLGIAERNLKKFDVSVALIERMVAIGTKTVGPSAPETINATTELSYSLIAQGKIKEALALLELSVVRAEQSDSLPPFMAAEAHLAYADALWRAGGDHAKARAAATVAHDGYAALGADFEKETKGAETWLATHR